MPPFTDVTRALFIPAPRSPLIRHTEQQTRMRVIASSPSADMDDATRFTRTHRVNCWTWRAGRREDGGQEPPRTPYPEGRRADLHTTPADDWLVTAPLEARAMKIMARRNRRTMPLPRITATGAFTTSIAAQLPSVPFRMPVEFPALLIGVSLAVFWSKGRGESSVK